MSRKEAIKSLKDAIVLIGKGRNYQNLSVPEQLAIVQLEKVIAEIETPIILFEDTWISERRM